MESNRFDFSRKKIYKEDVSALSKYMRNFKLDILDLSLKECNIGSNGIIELSASIAFLRNLSSLDLCGNNIGPMAIAELCNSILSLNETLQSLDLSSNSLGDKGAIVVAKVIPQMNILMKLDLTVNQIGESGVVFLSKSIKSRNSKLKTLILSGNSFGNRGIVAIKKAVSTFAPPKSAHESQKESYVMDTLPRNNIIEGTKPIATLSVLDLCYNDLGAALNLFGSAGHRV